MNLKQFKSEHSAATNRVINCTGSAVLFLLATLCGLIGQLLSASGWVFVRVLAVAAVIFVSFAGFVVVSAVAIIGASVAAVWTVAARLFNAGRFLLQWAAV